jgi:hypothetical protein
LTILGEETVTRIDQDGNSVTDLRQLNFRDCLPSAGRVVPIASDWAMFDQVMSGYRAFVDSCTRYVKGPKCTQGSLVSLVR